MNLKEQVEKLDGEIEELHNYVSMREENRTNRTMSLLTWITTIFLPFTVVAGYFSMNDFCVNPKFLFESILMICFAIVVISIVFIINKKSIK
jgi:Mg2+ and Co2+ transporter CorA